MNSHRGTNKKKTLDFLTDFFSQFFFSQVLFTDFCSQIFVYIFFFHTFVFNRFSPNGFFTHLQQAIHIRPVEEVEERVTVDEQTSRSARKETTPPPSVVLPSQLEVDQSHLIFPQSKYSVEKETTNKVEFKNIVVFCIVW